MRIILSYELLLVQTYRPVLFTEEVKETIFAGEFTDDRN